jgi:eukaryotic-like serine/threonine-protein kinase
VDDVTTRAPARVLADRYALLDRIGSGGAGVVWRAHDQLLGRTVAVKLLHGDLAGDPATTERFRAEAAAAAKLTHPHAVIVYDIGRDEEDGGDYLVMELVEGATLAHLFDDGPLPPGVVAALGHQIGRALGAAHARGLVHRDVKPANILVTADGVAKVADFGIARALGDATSRLTTTGHVMGTARYLAPEQLRDQTIDARADVYALGLVLHQALTGRQPFGEGTAIEVASRRLVDDLPPPGQLRDDVPPALDRAITRATKLDPDERYDDGAEFAATLADLAAPYAAKELATRVRRHPRPGEPTTSGGTPPNDGLVAPPVVPPQRPATPVDGLPAAGAGTAGGPGEAGDPQEAATTAALGAVSPPAHAPSAHAPSAHAPSSARSGDTVAEPATVPGQDGPRRRGLGIWVGLALLLATAIALVVAVGPGDDGAPVADGDGDADTEQTEEGEALAIVDGGDHDPFGNGEHPDRVPEAYDGDPSTYWRTQQYRGNPELGGLKPGVGIWLDLGEPSEVAEVVVNTTNPGASFTVFVGDAPPGGGDAPEDWGTAVAEVTDAGEEERLALDEVTEGQVWMLWFTSLPPDGGRYRATVSEVRLEAG